VYKQYMHEIFDHYTTSTKHNGLMSKNKKSIHTNDCLQYSDYISKVIIVDDSENIVNSYVKMFKKRNLDCICFYNGKDALTYIQQE